MKRFWTTWMLALGLLGPAALPAQSLEATLLAPAAPPAPHLEVALGSGALDRILSDYAPSAASPDPRASGFPGPDANAALDVLCDSPLGLSSALSGLGQRCLMSQLDGDDLGGFAEFSVRQQLLLSKEHGFDLSFGLSWLRPALQEPGEDDSLDLFSERFAPSAGLLGTRVGGESLSLEGSRWLGERGWLRVTGSSGRYRIDSPIVGLNSRWSRSALGVQAGFGDFSGSLVGHRTAVDTLDRSWFDLDLGLSWRTPWSGKVTVGARNLLNHPAEAPLPGTAGKPATLEESRTPYVRYQQDL